MDPLRASKPILRLVGTIFVVGANVGACICKSVKMLLVSCFVLCTDNQ